MTRQEPEGRSSTYSVSRGDGHELGGPPRGDGGCPSHELDRSASSDSGPFAEAWRQVSACLHESLGGDRFERWFSSTKIVGDDGATVTFGVPNLFIEGWIRQRYRPELERAIAAVIGRREVRFRVDGELFQQFRREEAQFLRQAPPPGVEGADLAQLSSVRTSSSRPASKSDAPSDLDAPRSRTEPDPAPKEPREVTTRSREKAGKERSPLDERLTLDRYVVGSCNHVAFNAGMEVLRQPGRSYNPLFVYGDSGLGKTHLLQGLTREYFRQGVRAIRYLPCEEFVNRFVRAIHGGRIEDFRRRFHRLEVLVLDDVHVLQRKPQSQIELLHVIDSIASAGGQVVLASDSRPHALEKLQKQLLGRFVSGLVCRIQEPDYPTRLAILRREAASRGERVPEEVLHAIARKTHRNVRELLGALVRVLASSTLLGAPLTEATALEALREENWEADRPVTLERILELQARRHGVSEPDFKSRSRARTVATARQEAMYLARALTEHSLAEIGRFFGGRNHATVNFAFQKVRGRMDEEDAYRESIEGAIRSLRS